MFGDAILAEVGDILKSSVGPEDILVRLGGDEFMLRLKNSNKGPMSLARRLHKKLKKSVIIKKDSMFPASIECALRLLSTNITAFTGVCGKHAAICKKHGKGKAAWLFEVSSELGTMLTQVYTENICSMRWSAAVRRTKGILRIWRWSF